MKEYIEREAAIQGILNDCCELVFYTKENAVDYLKLMPAADVAPVRHGRWILIRRQAASTIFKCSECGREEVFDSFHRLENTPCCHCGARMDKEEWA